jgi:hypothetical protein
VKLSVGATAVVAMILASGCSGGAAAPTASPPVPTETASSAAPSVAATTNNLVGSWHRAQTCQEMLAAFEAAGLAESHADWLTGNFFGGSPAPSGGDVCGGALGPLEHSHYFTETGDFGSTDENGQQVDDGDYVIEGNGKVAFPSHATEFGYGADLAVDYAIKDGVLTFNVALPQSCDSSCKDAYAWALSAFASGPWERGDVP